MYRPVLIRLFIASALVSAPMAVQAESTRLAPLHIKVSAGKMQNGIRIHKGQVPKTMQKADIAPALSRAKKSAQPQSCDWSAGGPLNENRVENLADSLKVYFSAQKRDPALIDTLLQASKETNADFELLVVKAMLESDIGKNMKSPTSTARGIFQYIEATWLVLMKRYGADIGYGHYAEAININAAGQPEISKTSPFTKADILELRFNPYIAALIKAHQISDEGAIMADFKTGGKLNPTDHYIIHMLGLSLAREFYQFKNDESSTILAFSENPMFREAVALNPAFFYDETHKGLTASEAYEHFKSRISKAYEKLRGIEKQYGKATFKTAGCGVPQTLPSLPEEKSASAMPAVKPAAVARAEILSMPSAPKTIMPAKGLSLAAIEAQLENMPK